MTKKFPKKLKVMPDFSSSGIWNEDCNGVMVEYEDLDLPVELKFLFLDWIELFEECWDENYTIMAPEKADILNKRGLELARKLKNIHPNIEISYVGETYTGSIIKPIKV